MAAIEGLVSELERSYRETQERLSDPAVFGDHRQAAEVGRRLKELEGQGLSQIMLYPPLNRQYRVIEDFADRVMARL